MPSSPKFVASAILAVYNAESTIEACLKSLLTQSVPVEIIIVDDGSTDQTLSIIHSVVPASPAGGSIQRNVKVLTQSHAGPALARNFGASHATSNILLFVDADMTFDRDYVKVLIQPILNYGFPTSKIVYRSIGSYTVEERVANWGNVWARCWNIQEGWQDKKRFPKDPPKYGTDFRAILKSEFDKVGGFDNIGYTDTWSLFGKLGVRPLSTRAICFHKNPDSLNSVFRQARWSAKRPYKYGLLGTLYALVRTSLPISLIIGIVKSYKDPIPALPAGRFVIFKLVYDFGRFVGILEMLITGRLAK